MVITGINSITPVGYNAKMTAASVRAGISRVVEFEDFYDVEGNPISVARIEAFNDEEDEIIRMKAISENCLENLLEEYFQDRSIVESEIHLLIGVATLSRPGPRYEGKDEEVAKHLAEIAKKWSKTVILQMFPYGNPSVIKGIEAAKQLLLKNPTALCIVGGIDSLLALNTLNWFEEAERLKSETFGRNQSFAPGEAVGFMTVESKEAALRRKKKIMVEIGGVGLAKEPAPFLSDQPTKGEGLTNACKIAIANSACKPNDICSIFGDLNGEFFRAKEWNYAEIRCFGNNNSTRKLHHPAEYFGSIGAASGIILTNIAVAGFERGWIKKSALIFCSDDEGECGVVILKRNSN